MNGLIGISLALALQQQPVRQPTASIVLAPDKPAIIMFRKGAEVQFEALCSGLDTALTVDGGDAIVTIKRSEIQKLLTDPAAPIDSAKVVIRTRSVRKITPDELRTALKGVTEREATLRALAAALNPMPNWPQLVMNGDASVCNHNPKPLPVVEVGTTWP